MDKQSLILGRCRDMFLTYYEIYRGKRKSATDYSSRIGELLRVDLFPGDTMEKILATKIPSGGGFYDLTPSDARQLIQEITSLPIYNAGLKKAKENGEETHLDAFFGVYEDFLKFIDVKARMKEYLASDAYRNELAQSPKIEDNYQTFLNAFPVAGLIKMKKEDYVEGLRDKDGKVRHSYCWFLEFPLRALGSISGPGDITKFALSYSGEKKDYVVTRKDFPTDSDAAFDIIRNDIVLLSQSHGVAALSALQECRIPTVLKNKISYLYNRDTQLPIYSLHYVRNIAIFLGLQVGKNPTAEELRFKIFDYCSQNGLVASVKNDTRILGVFLWSAFSGDRVVPVVDSVEENEAVSVASPSAVDYHGGENVIFYGVPGCGKSFYLDKEFCLGSHVFRTTFYQDYSYSDFIGQILPDVDESGENPTYTFKPGPFCKAFLYAMLHLSDKVCLVIEEINRGNAPAIFGDTFQLLDRKSGVSVYPIENDYIRRYLNQHLPKGAYDSFLRKEGLSSANEDTIALPGNLSILGTMNTSDQSVFVLDNAFKRRFAFVRISNDPKRHPELARKYVPGTSVPWTVFLSKVNELISKDADSPFEDKQIGLYFAEGMLADEPNFNDEALKRRFAMKVLEYLYDDVARTTRGDWFVNPNNFDAIIDDFMVNGLNVLTIDFSK